MASATKPLHARELPATRPGRFPIGCLQATERAKPRIEAAWDPWTRDQPHCLISGETGSGKSRLLEMWALEARSWGWHVMILDIKGGADFYVAHHADLPGTCELIWSENLISSKLAGIAKEINRRNAVMRDLAVLVPDSTGRMVESRATRLSDLPESMREDMPPRLVILDEAASLVALDRQGNGTPASDSLRKAVQLGRSAGVHLVLSIQRPDAEFLSGFTKNNLGDRIMLGAPRTAAADGMMFELPPDDDLTQAVRHSPRGVGVALAQGCGLTALSRVRVYLLDRERLLGDAPLTEPDPKPADPGPSPETAIVPATGRGPRDESSDDPWFRVDSEPPATGNDSQPPSGGLSPRPGAWKSPRPASPGLLPPRLRAALRGPVARLRLRAGASTLLRAPLADAPRTRSPILRQEALARDGRACRACGATHRPVEVDHRVPLWASGPDTLENVWVLDRKCHRAKTRAETAVRALRRRNGGKTPWAGKRLAFRLRDVPLLRSVYGWLYVAAFLTGLALPQYRLGALIGLAFVTIGVAILSNLLGMTPSGGGGLDRANSLDRKIESREPGAFGRVARTHWRIEKWMALLRLRLAIGCALFAAGGFAPLGWAWLASQAPLI